MRLKASHVVNKLLLAGLGLVALTQEKAKKLLEDLLGKEKVGKIESGAFIQELVERGKETQKKMADLVKREVAKILTKVDFASKKDIAELEKRVEELEAKLKNK